MVERLLWEQDVACSNRVIPTINYLSININEAHLNSRKGRVTKMKVLTHEGLVTLVQNISNILQQKQDVIEDLQLIKLGSQLGATSLQKHQDISGKADKATTLEGYGIIDTYTKDEIDSMISSVFTYKGSVENFEDLPTENNSIGDVYEVVSETANYSWNGEDWAVLGSMVDISNKADKATTLEGYGIEDTYTKDDLSAILNNNNPIIEDQKSYIVKGSTAFYNYKQASVNLYLMERQAEGFHALNPMGGSGLFVTNNMNEALTLLITVRNYNGYSTGSYKFGYANGDASPSDINYTLAGSDTVLVGSGTVRSETLIPLTIPAGKKGFFINTAWTHESATDGPLEITECYTNEIFEVNDNFQGMTIKTEALLPTPVILTQEEYDAIEPKKNTCMYYIIEE